jgi:hypothetical protein
MSVQPVVSRPLTRKMWDLTPISKHITLTKAQRHAVFKLYSRNVDGAHSYRQFRQRVFPGFGGAYVMVQWCGMYVGIETDGHSHT